MAHEFISIDGTLNEVLSILPNFSGRPIYVKYAPDWSLYIVADEPITLDKAMRWWNEDLSPNDEDYAFVPPKLTDSAYT